MCKMHAKWVTCLECDLDQSQHTGCSDSQTFWCFVHSTKVNLELYIHEWERGWPSHQLYSNQVGHNRVLYWKSHYSPHTYICILHMICMTLFPSIIYIYCWYHQVDFNLHFSVCSKWDAIYINKIDSDEWLSEHSLVPRPLPLRGKRGLVNIDTFLGFVGGVVYLVSYDAKTNLHSDWSGQKRRQFNQSHSKRKPTLWSVPLNSCSK